MTYRFPAKRWSGALVTAITHIQDGDELVVHCHEMETLAKRLLRRNAPDKKVYIIHGRPLDEGKR